MASTGFVEPNEAIIPTPEMALFPGIVISTGSTIPTATVNNSPPIVDPNNIFKQPLQVQDTRKLISHIHDNDKTCGTSKQTENIPKRMINSPSSSNMVHFKKAFIHSSTGKNLDSKNDHKYESSKPIVIVESNFDQLENNNNNNNNDNNINNDDDDDDDSVKDNSTQMPINIVPVNIDSETMIDNQSISKVTHYGFDMSVRPKPTSTITNTTTSPPIIVQGENKQNSRGSKVSPMMMPIDPAFPAMPQVITHVGRKPLNGPPCSLKTLVDDGILEPMDGSLTYEILGAKFFGDLLLNGFIRMSGTSQIFANPSSWANYCRSTLPSTSKDHKNYGSAWSIIRYLGKRLDSYKLRWYRKQKKQFMGTSNSANSGGLAMSPMICKSGRNTPFGSFQANTSMMASPFSNPSLKYSMNNFPPIPINYGNYYSTPIHQSRSGVEYKNIYSFINRDRLYTYDKSSAGDPDINAEEAPTDETILNFNSIDLNSKEWTLSDRTKIYCVPFNSVYCLQPFIVTVSTNVLLLIDFHSHLISKEIFGYLAGTWDVRTQHLKITQAFPMRYHANEKSSHLIKIKQNLVQKDLILIGWYHSHPSSMPHPSIHDIKKQLNYQKQLLMGKKGLRDYTPCVGMITSPYYKSPTSPKLNTLFQMFWVMPIFTIGNRNIGRPMQISYYVSRDAFLTHDLLIEMRVLASHFSTSNKFIKFTDNYLGDSTYWDKLQESLKTKLPKDLVETQSQAVQNDIQQQALMHFWSFLKNLLLIS